MSESETIRGMNFYCDLWCERCALTDRCESYPIIYREDASTPGGFMQRQMQSISQMQLDFMATAGEFQVRVEMEDFFKITEARSPYLSNGHIRRLIRQARDFARLVSRFLSSGQAGTLEVWEDQEALSNVVDEIIWYKIQTQFRLTLAGILRIWEKENTGVRRVPWLHSDGYAKSAMSAIDRFQTALSFLLACGWGNTEIAERLSFESVQLREEVLSNFPEAPQYVRPGFDEPDGMLLCAAPAGAVC